MKGCRPDSKPRKDLMANADWTAGYVADVNYVFGYYPELNPLRARLPLLNKGFHPKFQPPAKSDLARA